MLGRSYLAPSAEDVQANLDWSGTHGALLGRKVKTDSGDVQAGLVLAELTLILVKEGEVLDRLPLAQRTMNEAIGWIKHQLADSGLDPEGLSDHIPYDLPPYAQLMGRPFEREQAAVFDAMGIYYANADLTLKSLCRREPQASVVKCWPHHFDLATLMSFDLADEIRYIGVGFSPADAEQGFEEPYYYVNYHPQPEQLPSTLPPFEAGGAWTTQHWVGSILTATELTSTLNYEQQQRMAEAFMAQSVQAGKQILAIN